MEVAAYLDGKAMFLHHKEKKLLIELLNGGIVTRETAMREFNIQNLPAAIKRMRDNGFPISTERFMSAFNRDERYVIYGISATAHKQLRYLGRIIYNNTLKAWLPTF